MPPVAAAVGAFFTSELGAAMLAVGVGLAGGMLLSKMMGKDDYSMSSVTSQAQQKYAETDPVASMPEAPASPAVPQEDAVSANPEAEQAKAITEEEAARAVTEYNPTGGLGITSNAQGKGATLGGV